VERAHRETSLWTGGLMLKCRPLCYKNRTWGLALLKTWPYSSVTSQVTCRSTTVCLVRWPGNMSLHHRLLGKVARSTQ
jgi:hypothetical protein